MTNIVIEGGDEMVRAIRNRFNEDKVARVVKRNKIGRASCRERV